MKQLQLQGRDKPGKKNTSKHICSYVERGVSIVVRFTSLVYTLCVFSCKKSMQVLIL